MRIEPTIADADVFKPNSYFENLAKLKAEKPEVFAVLSESERLTLTIYEEQKQKHSETEKSPKLAQARANKNSSSSYCRER